MKDIKFEINNNSTVSKRYWVYMSNIATNHWVANPISLPTIITIFLTHKSEETYYPSQRFCVATNYGKVEFFAGC